MEFGMVGPMNFTLRFLKLAPFAASIAYWGANYVGSSGGSVGMRVVCEPLTSGGVEGRNDSDHAAYLADTSDVECDASLSSGVRNAYDM